MSIGGLRVRPWSEEVAMNNPSIVSQAEWLEARKALLAKEKELTRFRDQMDAASSSSNIS
jgi:predicted dithiol-disulfide oxidoreductase (DUF899 family)